MRTLEKDFHDRHYVTVMGSLDEIEQKQADLYEQYEHVTVENVEGMFTFNETVIANIVCY